MYDEAEFLGRTYTVVRVWFLSAKEGGRYKPFEGAKWMGTCEIGPGTWSVAILFDTPAHGGWRIGRAFLMTEMRPPPLPNTVDGLEGPKRVAIIVQVSEEP